MRAASPRSASTCAASAPARSSSRIRRCCTSTNSRRPSSRASRSRRAASRTSSTPAVYLTNALQPIESPALTSDAGLWAWLALYYFDQLSPVGADGKRRPREDYHYITGGAGGWVHERHLLAGPYRIYHMHGERARLLLHPAVHQHGTFIYDLSFHRDLITNRGLITAIDMLYWNPRTKRPKRGATTSTRPGNLRRLIAVAAAARPELRPLRHARRRDPLAAAGGVRGVVAGAAARCDICERS